MYTYVGMYIYKIDNYLPRLRGIVVIVSTNVTEYRGFESLQGLVNIVLLFIVT
jgi:hypothetical protein